MSYEKRPSKRKVPPSKEKSIIEHGFGSGAMEVEGSAPSVYSPERSVRMERDPLAISPERKTSTKVTNNKTEWSTGIGDEGDMDEDEIPGVLVFDETEVDMEQAEVYLGDRQDEHQLMQNESGDPLESEGEGGHDEDFAEKLRRNAWLGLPNRVLNKVESEAELETKLCGDHLQEDGGDEEGWETMSESSSSSGEMDPDGDWEESLVYVELDDLPNIQELFAVHPDDFLRFQHRNKRHRSQPVKATHSKLDFQFHNFTSSHPTLQIGQRYFSGQWEEPAGSAVFFRRNGEMSSEERVAKNSSAPTSRPCDELKSIVPEPDIPFDPVFMKLGASYKNAYECVAVADKVLKMSAHIASTKKMPKTVKPGGNRLLGGSGLNVPKGYTARAILAGQYKPMRTYVNKKYKKGKVQRWKQVQGELTILNENDQDQNSEAGTSKAVAGQDTEVILS